VLRPQAVTSHLLDRREATNLAAGVKSAIWLCGCEGLNLHAVGGVMARDDPKWREVLHLDRPDRMANVSHPVRIRLGPD
jgi:hypothetical protein